MSGYTHNGVVYFAKVGRYVKIGYTASNVTKRLQQIATGQRVICPHDFEPGTAVLLHSIPNAVQRDEARIHSLLDQHRAEGEWFYLTSAFLAHVARMEYVTYRESLLRFRHARAALKRTPSILRSAA